LSDKYPEFKAEFKDVYAVPTLNRANNQIGTKKVQIKKLEDMKGLIIRSVGKVQTEAVKLLGASPATVPAGEMYDSVSKGVIDGVVNGLVSFVLNYKLYEVCPYYTQIDMDGSAGNLVINLDTWKSLPPELQKYFQPDQYKRYGDAWGFINDQQEVSSWTFLDKYYKSKGGQGIYVMPKEERARLITATLPTYENWVKNVTPIVGEAKARAILADAKTFAQQNAYTDVIKKQCTDTVTTFGIAKLLPAQ
jgi:TRAP-type transport system periplasmic protein